ncbi:MAG: SDR family oxidoreductase [Phycisphaerales bacterium]
MTEQKNGKVAIVTGAGSGVGEQIAVMLAEEGYRLVLVGRTKQTLDRVGEGLATEWVSVVADVGVVGDRERVIEEAVGAFGRVDALVNNAGLAVFNKMARIEDGELDAMFAVNAVGPVDLARRVVGDMAKRGDGVIVNVSSMAQVDPFAGLGVYGCAKGAVGVLAKAVANEYGDKGVRGYSICPGAIETRMLRSFLPESALPTSATLAPAEVARVVVDCVIGETDLENGAIFEMPSH